MKSSRTRAMEHPFNVGDKVIRDSTKLSVLDVNYTLRLALVSPDVLPGQLAFRFWVTYEDLQFA